MVNLQALIDNSKCFEAVRSMRWPDGVRCPGCGSAEVTRDGRDDTLEGIDTRTLASEQTTLDSRRDERTMNAGRHWCGLRSPSGERLEARAPGSVRVAADDL